MQSQLVKYSKTNRVATITLNRPEVLNAINRDLHGAWVGALQKADSDSDVSVVVVNGAGRAFSAGHDLKEDVHHPLVGQEQWRSALKKSMDLALMIWDMDKPVIASVHGYCLGKAFQIVEACDLVIAAEDAVLGEPEVRFVASSTFPILPFLIGLRKAKEMMLMGATVSGKEGEGLGLVNKSVPLEHLAAETEKIAQQLAKVPIRALTLNKRTMNRNLEVIGIRAAVAYNLEYVSAIESAVAQEGERADFTEAARKKGLKKALEARDSDFEPK